MFKKRLLTAVCLIPFVVFLIFYKPAFFVFALMGLMILALTEWVVLIPLEGKNTKVIVITLGAMGLFVSYWLTLNFSMVVLSICLWGYFTGCICIYPNAQDAWNGKLFMTISMLVLVLGCFQALYGIRLEYGSQHLLYLLCLIWGADTGAYFAGKAFGTHKLIPYVSPGKTLEGVLGALFTTAIIATIGLFQLNITAYLAWYLISFMIAIVSIFGDLLISMFKRHVGVKDTGTLLPGHGGILDRIDSLLSASVFFYSFMKLL